MTSELGKPSPLGHMPSVYSSLYTHHVCHLIISWACMLPLVHTTDYIQILKKLLKIHKDVHLCMYIMYANGNPSLTSISRSRMFWHIVCIKKHLSRELYLKMDTIFWVYTNARYTITHLHTDNEFQPFAGPHFQRIASADALCCSTRMRATGREESLSCQKCFRTLYHGLPYQMLLILMVTILLAKVVTRINFFPNKHGIPYYSPRAMLNKSKINYTQHCAIPFGTYVTAPHEANPYNTMAPWALDCIYMQPLYTVHGGHELYHIPTRKLITQHGKVALFLFPDMLLIWLMPEGRNKAWRTSKSIPNGYPLWMP